MRRLALLTALLAHPLLAADPVAVAPWDQTALGLFKDAHAAFAQQPADDRDARFGEAVTLLSLQPKTDANLDRAASLFSAIVAAGADDDLGLSSRYYLARIPQVHRATPDTATALARFQDLAQSRSSHPLAQRAVVQIALIELFEPRLPQAEVRSRYDRLASRGAELTEPSALRDFHLVMGDAALRFSLGEEAALDHLLAADRAGIARAITQRDTWLRIAELGRKTGRTGVSKEYYARFLDTFPRDSRRLSVKQRLADLP